MSLADSSLPFQSADFLNIEQLIYGIALHVIEPVVSYIVCLTERLM